MYNVALFVHILGVVLLVLSLSYTLGGLAMAQQARDVDGVRRALTFVPVAEKVIPVAMLVIPLAGVYMASRHGDNGKISWTSGWLDVAFAVFAVMLFLGPAVEGKRISALHQAADEAGPGPIPADIAARLADPVLSHVGAFGASQVVAFLYLMTNKPSLADSVAAVIVAAAVSIPLGRLMVRSALARAPHAAVPAQAQPATTSIADRVL